MGSFSWLKSDDLTEIENVYYGSSFKCLIPKEFGGGYVQDKYQDYGYLGTKPDGSEQYDMYELLSFWNYNHPYKDGKVGDYLKFDGEFTGMKEIDEYTDHNRIIGIEIGCYDEQMDQLKYPLKLVSVECTDTYESCEGKSYNDPHQGFGPTYRDGREWEDLDEDDYEDEDE